MHHHPIRRTLGLTVLAVLTVAAAWAGDAPSNLAGIELGGVAAHMKSRIRTHKSRAVDGSPWLRRLPVVPDKYYAGGYVLVGTCAAPGRVIRIKMHYRDESLDFFRKIAGEMLARYGDPTEYKGGIDGRTMGNKWSFNDPWARPLSLILQRTEGEDPETGTGNTIKLTNWGMLEAERACWQERQPATAGKAKSGLPARTDTGYLPR